MVDGFGGWWADLVLVLCLLLLLVVVPGLTGLEVGLLGLGVHEGYYVCVRLYIKFRVIFVCLILIVQLLDLGV